MDLMQYACHFDQDPLVQRERALRWRTVIHHGPSWVTYLKAVKFGYRFGGRSVSWHGDVLRAAARGATRSSVVSAGRSSVARVVSEIAPFIRTKNERAVEFSRYSVAYLW